MSRNHLTIGRHGVDILLWCQQHTIVPIQRAWAAFVTHPRIVSEYQRIDAIHPEKTGRQPVFCDLISITLL
jgi:hypothetical protein